jgi:hypothetical protein
MKHLAVLCVCALLTAGTSSAEAQRLPFAAGTVTPAGDDLGPQPTGAPATQGQSAQVQPVREPPPPRPRRRGSMVGYVEDALIESKVRIRFDAALENAVPDRAEFFYAKCGCYRDLDPNDPAFDPESPGPRPGLATEVDFRQLYLSAEYAFTPRVSAFGQLPFRWLAPQSFEPGTGSFSNQSGIDDIRAGLKFGLVATEAQSVTGQVKFFFPTGDAARGLGTDHATVEPALLYYQRVNDLVSLESQFGVWLPVGGADPVPITGEGTFAGDVLFYGIGSSFSVARTDRVRLAPVVELVGWRVLNGFQSAAVGDASGTNIVNLKLGARTVFAQGSIYVGYGLALTDASWYDDIVRFEYRYEF